MPSLTSSAAWPIDAPFYAVLVSAVLYHFGGKRRVSPRRASVESRLRVAAFYGALAVVLVAVDSPLDPLAEKLFAAHMAQHVLLLTVAPPLLVFAAPWTRIWRPLPLGFRRAVAKTLVRNPRLGLLRAAGRRISHPFSAWFLFNANLILWHLPSAYDETLRNPAVHQVEHFLFFATGLLFWAQVIESPPLRVRLDWLRRVAFVTTGMLVGWVLAVVLAFAVSPVYPVYAQLATRPWGLSALSDQQLAAGVMWVPGSLAYTLAIIVFFYRWLAPESSPGLAAATDH